MDRSSKGRVISRFLPRILFFSLLSFPFIVLLGSLGFDVTLDREEFLWALKNTVYQAGASAVLATIGAFVFAFGLLSLKKLSRFLGTATEIVLLAPNFLPVLFTILAFFSLGEFFPMGVLGIAAIHAFINAGLGAVLFSRVFQERLASYAEVSETLGAGFFRFWRRSFYLIRSEILQFFLFVFTLSFVSFSVPLVVGGNSGTTLEILIYEKIRISGNWTDAFLLSVFQTLFVFGLSFLVLRTPSHSPVSRPSHRYLQSSFAALILCLVYFSYVGVLLNRFQRGLFRLLDSLDIFSEALTLVVPSFLYALLVSGAVCFLLILSAWRAPDSVLDRGLRGFLGPTTAIVGFALLKIEISSATLLYLLGFCSLYFASIYRMGFGEKLSSISSQLSVARSLGAGESLILRKILWPQIRSLCFSLSTIAGIWALGDFGLSRIVFSRDQTLGLFVQTLMSSYRIDWAFGVSLLILLLALVIVLIYKGLDYVLSHSS